MAGLAKIWSKVQLRTRADSRRSRTLKKWLAETSGVDPPVRSSHDSAVSRFEVLEMADIVVSEIDLRPVGQAVAVTEMSISSR
jgi:hypothetical protein